MRCLPVILALVLLASCSLKKRTYREGYYVDWAFQRKNKISKQKEESLSPEKEKVQTEIASAVKINETNELLSGEQKQTKLLLDTCGDIITLKSGDKVIARVTEITDDKVKYKRCDNLDGPVFVVNKTTVSSIRYTNGVEEKIEAPQPDYTKPPYTSSGTSQKYHGPLRVHPLATWSLISLILGFFLFGLGVIIAFFLANAAIKQITMHPDLYKGMKLARIVKGISIGIMVFIITLLIFLLVLA